MGVRHKSVSLLNQPLLRALVISNLVCIGFFVARIIASNTLDYWFLMWNLLLGALPLLFAWLATHILKPASWQQLVILVAWLVFLPNSFYVVTDFIHLQETGQVSILFDTVWFFLITFNAYIFGYLSLFFVHSWMLRTRVRKSSAAIIAAVLLLTSFAIYLGRYLRWSTWDIVLSPAGLLFDVSDRFVNPELHPQAMTTTLAFFILLSTIYYVLWQVYLLVSRKR